MTHRIVVTATDTDVGKTIFSSALVGALDGIYWKPVQAGIDGGTDSETVRRLSGLSPDRILPEAYRLETPASPHLAAAIDGVTIDHERLEPPSVDRPLVIEGAGGLLVPLTPDYLTTDLFARWKLPTVLVCRTSLGTINHSLLSIEALRARGIPIIGVAFVGDSHEENERIIPALGKVRGLGRLPRLDPLDAPTLAATFRQAFDIKDFGGDFSA